MSSRSSSPTKLAHTGYHQAISDNDRDSRISYSQNGKTLVPSQYENPLIVHHGRLQQRQEAFYKDLEIYAANAKGQEQLNYSFVQHTIVKIQDRSRI